MCVQEYPTPTPKNWNCCPDSFPYPNLYSTGEMDTNPWVGVCCDSTIGTGCGGPANCGQFCSYNIKTNFAVLASCRGKVPHCAAPTCPNVKTFSVMGTDANAPWGDPWGKGQYLSYNAKDAETALGCKLTKPSYQVHQYRGHNIIWNGTVVLWQNALPTGGQSAGDSHGRRTGDYSTQWQWLAGDKVLIYNHKLPYIMNYNFILIFSG